MNLFKRGDRLYLIFGVFLSLGSLICFYPSFLYNYPTLNVDSVSHFNYVRELIDNGISVLFHLTPDGRYYPPLFHLLAFLVYSTFSVFGINLSVATAVSAVWFLGAGIIWPSGLYFLVKTFFGYFGCRLGKIWAIIIPLLSVSLAVFPLSNLQIGTLYAYGFASALLPFLMTSTIRVIKVKTRENFVKLFVILILVIFCQPRILFTFVLLMLPFFTYLVIEYINNVKKKDDFSFRKYFLGKLLSVIVVVSFLLTSLFIYVKTHLRSDLLFHPENWFIHHAPNNISHLKAVFSIVTARLVFSNSTFFGINYFVSIMFVCSLVVICALLFFRYNEFRQMRFVVLFSFILYAFFYTVTTVGRSGVENLLAAPWYKEQVRLSVGFPIICVLVIVLSCLCIKDIFKSKISGKMWVYSKCLFVIILILFMFIPQLSPNYQAFEQVKQKSSFDSPKSRQNSFLNAEKVAVFKELKNIIPNDAKIIGDPYNGSSFIYALEGVEHFFITVNPHFSGVSNLENPLNSFKETNSSKMLKMICPYSGDANKNSIYFLDLGKVFSKSFENYRSFSQFHNQKNISKYLKDGAIKEEKTFINKWVLYKVNC